MGFIQGRKEWLINSESNYPTKFYNDAMVEQTSLANILANATIGRIEGYGTFKLSTIRNVRALRGFVAASQVIQITENNLAVTAPSAGEVVNYVSFDVIDHSYSSAYARNQMKFGKSEKVQVVVGPSDTNLTIAGQIFTHFINDETRFPANADRPLTAYIPTGNTINVLYANGTVGTGILLAADYYPGDLLGGLAVDKVTSINAPLGTDPLIRFVAETESLFVKVSTYSDGLPSTEAPIVTALATTLTSATEGRNTAKFLRESYTMLNERNVQPYQPSKNHQLPIDGCLYSEISFDVVLERNEIGGLSAINTIQTTSTGFTVMVKEDTDNLNATTGLIAKLLTFLGKNGKLADGYSFYNDTYGNPNSALASTVFSADNTTAWNEATHSGVVRTAANSLAGDVTQFVD